MLLSRNVCSEKHTVNQTFLDSNKIIKTFSRTRTNDSFENSFCDKEGFWANELLFQQDIPKTGSFKNSFVIRNEILKKHELDVGKTRSFKRGLAIRTGLKNYVHPHNILDWL